jgi:hypothetical protein
VENLLLASNTVRLVQKLQVQNLLTTKDTKYHKENHLFFMISFVLLRAPLCTSWSGSLGAMRKKFNGLKTK